MLEESQFHCLADSYLEALAEAVESQDSDARIDADIIGSVLTLTLPGGSQYVISKHLPSKQVWLSSPVSGGLHFSYNEEDSAWELTDGRKLSHLLAQELEKATGTSFTFSL